MSSKRTNPDLVSLSNINDLVIPPPKGYTFFEDADQHAFAASATAYSNTNAWWLAEFATLIYETEANIKKKIGKLTDKPVKWLNNKRTHTQYFVVELEGFTVVSFRGTELIRPAEILDMEKINNFLQDSSTLVDIGGAELRGVNVHGGIRNALNSVWDQLHPILNNTSHPVWFTGHSLGGALAMLAAFKWEEGLDKIGGVYTIGCPAIGGSEFKEKYNNELQDKTFHHIYGEDLITHIGQIIGNITGT